MQPGQPALGEEGTVGMLATSPRPDAASEEAALFAWVAETCGGPVQRATPASGGNRCRSWAVDVAAPGGTVEAFLRYAPPRPARQAPNPTPSTVRRRCIAPSPAPGCARPG